ncbi:MAG TPA: TVP38/TMEM64 family protein [Methylomirabilota bacterium]|nr:TVP38/TMEM64 family protein [Methylomirabilota bacterium]
MSPRARWAIVLGVSALFVAGCAWLVWTDAPVYRFIVRLYVDKLFLKQTLRDWGVLAPVVFMALQALQVVVSPIPGEATGILGGYLFGQWLGLLYSTIGLTLGSVAAFAIGRWLGAHSVRNLVSPETWNRLGFIVEAEGAVLCFIIYLIPGLPKDIVCYLFGISPMPLWVFALVSGLGRIPGTWVLSAQGAHTAAGDYREAILVTAMAVAVALPLYYYRHRITRWLQGRNAARGKDVEGGLDREKPGS